MADMIITSECEHCIHSIINEQNKSKIEIYCKIKNKTYYWGQCVPCDYKSNKIDIKKEKGENSGSKN